jgi:hypothetical protein
MKKKVLVFTSTERMAEFIIATKKYNVIVNFPKYTVSGFLTDAEVRTACSLYGAQLALYGDMLIEDEETEQ